MTAHERSKREEQTKLYWRLVRTMARDVYRSDGCSGVPDFRVDSCLEHDLFFRSGRRWAVVETREVETLVDEPQTLDDQLPTLHGGEVETLGGESTTVPRLMAFEIVTRDWANERFRYVNQRMSYFGRWSPMAWWRWLGVTYLPFSSDTWYRYRTEGTFDDITAAHLWRPEKETHRGPI